MAGSSRSHYRYFLFWKPYGVLSQFTRGIMAPAPERYLTLRNFGPFPPGLYPVGRLDKESEGLLLLTDDNELKHRLTDPRGGHSRTYLVQVEGIPSKQSVERLRIGGIPLGQRSTRPAGVRVLEQEPVLPERSVPIRFRKRVPTCWLELILQEGMNRQVRRMTAAVGHPTLRLVRAAIGGFSWGGLQPGQHRELAKEESAALRKSAGLPALPLLQKTRGAYHLSGKFRRSRGSRRRR